MELREALWTRRMVRSYDPERPVSESALETCLKAAFRAPSAGHTRGRRFLVLDDITSRDLFWSTTSDGAPDDWRRRMMQAPVLVLVFADRQAYLDRYAEPDKARSPLSAVTDWPVPYWHVDSGMSILQFMLAGHDLGLGSCLFGVPPDRVEAVLQTFSVPPGLEPVGVVSLGHPAPDRRSPSLRRRTPTFAEAVAYRSFAPVPPS